MQKNVFNNELFYDEMFSIIILPVWPLPPSNGLIPLNPAEGALIQSPNMKHLECTEFYWILSLLKDELKALRDLTSLQLHRLLISRLATLRFKINRFLASEITGSVPVYITAEAVSIRTDCTCLGACMKMWKYIKAGTLSHQTFALLTLSPFSNLVW